MFGALAGVYRVVEQDSLSYKKNLEKYKPNFVVHGDDWNKGYQKAIREEVVKALKKWDGELVEYPYAITEKYRRIEKGYHDNQRVLHSMDGQQELIEYLKECSPKKILLVCGKNVQSYGLENIFDSVRQNLGIEEVVFEDFKPNPSYESVVAGVKLYKNEQCDMIAAVGGGSAIDVAKCIKLFSGADDSLDFLKQEIKANSIPLLAVPTTAGSGSEATRYAVIYKDGIKKSISSVSCIPNAVLNAPELLHTLPDYHRKSTMLDALCHAIESAWSINSTEESLYYSSEAIRLIRDNYDSYLANEESGNRNMLYAARIAGKAINITQTTAGHAMSYVLTTEYGIAHGHAAALCVKTLWKHMRDNYYKTNDSRGSIYLKEILDKLESWFGAEKFVDFFDRLNMPSLKCDNEEILFKFTDSINVERLSNHPIVFGKKDIFGIYKKIFNL